MKYCSHCGAEVNDEAVVCVKCGCALKSLHVCDKHDNELLVASKILMIVSCVVFPLAGISCGLYVGMIIWYIGLIMGVCFSLPIVWGIPMIIVLSRKIKNHEPIGIKFKICTLLFLNILAGVLMLSHKDE